MKRRDLTREYYVIPVAENKYRAQWRDPIEYTFYASVYDWFKNKPTVKVEYDIGYVEELMEFEDAIIYFRTSEDAQKYIDEYISMRQLTLKEREDMKLFQKENPPVRYK